MKTAMQNNYRDARLSQFLTALFCASVLCSLYGSPTLPATGTRTAFQLLAEGQAKKMNGKVVRSIGVFDRE